MKFELFLVASITLVNLLLWAVFIVRFKNYFSTEDEIQKFRDNINRILRDIQQQTTSCVDVSVEARDNLKRLLSKAEKQIDSLKKDIDFLQRKTSLVEQVDFLQRKLDEISLAPQKPGAKKRSAKTAQNKYAEKYMEHSVAQDQRELGLETEKTASYENDTDISDEEQALLTGLFRENEKSLLSGGFFKGQRKKRYKVFDDISGATATQTVTVRKNGDAYGKVPLLRPELISSDDLPEIYKSENPIVPKKDFQTQVRDLSAMGRSVEEIAEATMRSQTEVELALALI